MLNLRRAITLERQAAFSRYLRAWPDVPALEDYMERRRAQHLDEFARDQDGGEDVTVSERGPRR